jgi:hypothetical protein
MADLSDGDSLGPLCRDCAPPSCHLPPTRDGSGATVGSRERTVPCLAGDHCGGRGGGGDGGGGGLAPICGDSSSSGRALGLNAQAAAM